jgi:hypothetical protein
MDRIIPKSHVAAASEAGRTVLVDLLGGQYYSLNQTGSLIWFLMIDGVDTTTIAAQLASQYAISPAEARTHVDTFARHLAERALVDI